MGISLKDIFKNDEERLVENRRKTTIRNLIIFICALVVLIVVAVVIRYWGSVDETRRIAITKDVQNIRTAILARAEQNISNSSSEYPGSSLENSGEVLLVNGLVESTKNGRYVLELQAVNEEYKYGYYLLKPEDLGEIAVSLNLPNETYIVNYDTGDVVNVFGIKYNGKKYYSYDDLVAIENGKTPISDQTMIISKASDLDMMRKYPGGYFKLSADIDMREYNSSKEGWDPIENFDGIFDGRGYTISNLTINRATEDYIGLFGNAKSSSKITNLKLEGVRVTGGEFTGALAGNCSGMISNVHITSGEVTGFKDSTGGLVGTFSIGKINNCTVNANVDGDRNVGGVIGTLYNGSVGRVKMNGNVTATQNAGGFIGLARISDTTQINECVASIEVNGKENLGGFVGAVEMTASRNLEIINSYAKGSVATGESNIGGMFGQIYTIQGTPSIILENLYSTVSVVIKGETSGGSVGYCRVGGSTTQECTNSFWEKNIAPGTVLNDVGKASEGSTIAFIAKTPEDMKMMRMYTDWNFESVWEIQERIGTPTLRWEKSFVFVEESEDE